MPDRPRKLRRKEVGEKKVSGKLSKTGLTMTCSLCHVKGHNKRSCHLRRSDGVGSTAGEQRDTPTSNVEIKYCNWGCWFQTDKRIEVERKSGNHN